jgi:hypothetical protein
MVEHGFCNVRIQFLGLTILKMDAVHKALWIKASAKWHIVILGAHPPQLMCHQPPMVGIGVALF